jgi:hypothetical protein
MRDVDAAATGPAMPFDIGNKKRGESLPSQQERKTSGVEYR